MWNAVRDFLRDEGGNATIESLVVIGGSVWMAGVLITDITFASMVVSERLNTRLEYNSIVEDILGGYGTDEQQAKYSEPDESGEEEDDEVDCVGNPGNDKCVGNAGENPNGGDDWGSGSNGMSDSGSTGSGSSSGSSGGRGNSGNAPGRNK